MHHHVKVFSLEWLVCRLHFGIVDTLKQAQEDLLGLTVDAQICSRGVLEEGQERKGLTLTTFSEFKVTLTHRKDYFIYPTFRKCCR